MENEKLVFTAVLRSLIKKEEEKNLKKLELEFGELTEEDKLIVRKHSAKTIQSFVKSFNKKNSKVNDKD